MSSGLLPPLKPLPIKERISVVFVERGEIDMLDGAFVVVDATGVRTHIPVGGVACIMMEPGTRFSHRAVALAARVGTLLDEPAPSCRSPAISKCSPHAWG